MATPQQLSQQLTKIAQNWSPELVRNQVQFGTFLAALAKHPKLTPETVEAARALQNNVMQKKVCVVESSVISTSTDMRCPFLVPAFCEDAETGVGASSL